LFSTCPSPFLPIYLPFLLSMSTHYSFHITTQYRRINSQCFQVSSPGICTQCTLSIKWANWKWKIHVTMMKECVLCLKFWLSQICLLLFSQFPKYHQTKWITGR
jgi:hypothetical protein